MNIWHNISSSRISGSNFYAAVEIPSGSKLEYKMDKETGCLLLERVLYTAAHYPANYGFIPRTMAEDNDPLDVMIISDEAFEPMTLVNCHPIGLIVLDDGSQRDEKIIAVTQGDPTYFEYRSIGELPRHIIDEMSHFFTAYKDSEGKKTYLMSIKDTHEAVLIIEESISRYKEKIC